MKKKNKGKGRLWIGLALCFSVLLSVAVPVAAVAADGAKDLPRPDRAEVDTSYRGWVTVPEEDTVACADVVQGGVSVGMKEEKRFSVTVPEAGDYAIVLKYAMEEAAVLDATVTVSLLSGGDTVQSARAEVYSLWQDETKDYALDRYGNEVSPSQVTLSQDVTDYVREYSSADGSPVAFFFEKGEQTIVLLPNDVALTVKEVKVVKLPKVVDY